MSFKKDIEMMKKNQSEMNNIITDTKNTLERINIRLDETEDQTRDLKDKTA